MYDTSTADENFARKCRPTRSTIFTNIARSRYEDYNYTHGPVVTVKDLSDPAGECTKTLYIHRIVDAEGLDIDSGSDGEEFAEDDLVSVITLFPSILSGG